MRPSDTFAHIPPIGYNVPETEGFFYGTGKAHHRRADRDQLYALRGLLPSRPEAARRKELRLGTLWQSKAQAFAEMPPCEAMFFRLVRQYAEREGVTEQLKAEDMMQWVGRMNNIRSRVEDVVMREYVYEED